MASSDSNQITYEKISHPYGANLARLPNTPTLDGSQDVNKAFNNPQQKSVFNRIFSPYQLGARTVSNQVFNDAWISSWIKSVNYKPKTTGLKIDGRKGSIDCRQLFVKDLNIGNRIIHVSIGDNVQNIIDSVEDSGGGEVVFSGGQYLLDDWLDVPSTVALSGLSSALTILDFQNEACGIRAVGSNSYSTGTVSISNDSTAVVGVGTTFTSSMIGQFILLEDFWYEIQAFGDATHLTISSSYLGTTLAGSTFKIATTVESVNFKGFTVQNSTTALIKAQYINGLIIDDIYFYNGLIGVDGDDSSSISILNSEAELCGTGMTFNNSYYGTYFNSNILGSTSGGGLILNQARNWAIDNFSMQNLTGTALSFQSCSNIGVENYSIREITGKGIEFVSSNSDITLSDGQEIRCSSDGIKLTATSDSIQIALQSIHDNGGYGVNVAAATCDNNLILGNTFANNTSGAANDSGTTTKIRSNVGLADN